MDERYDAKSTAASYDSDSEERLMELNDENLLFCPSFSDENRSVFFFVNLFCDESTAIGRCNVMFRGDQSVMDEISAVRLALYDAGDTQMAFASLGIATQDDDSEDPRILVFKNWTSKVPLPLGGCEVPLSQCSRIALVLFHSKSWDKRSLKLQADVVASPDIYRENARLKRTLRDCGNGVLRVSKGRVVSIENAQNALELEHTVLTTFFAQKKEKADIVDAEMLELAPLFSKQSEKTEDTSAASGSKPSLSSPPLWRLIASKPRAQATRFDSGDLGNSAFAMMEE